MQASTGMYSLGAGVLVLGAILGVRYTAGVSPAGAAAAQPPPPAPAAAPAFANLAPAAPLHAADPDKPRYFGPDGISLLITSPNPAPRPTDRRVALDAAADPHR